MKRNIVLYLFVFSLLINLFQYVNTSKFIKAKESEVQASKNALKVTRDSIKNFLQESFDLKYNDNAQEYFYQKNIDYNKVLERLSEDLNAMNAQKSGNPLVEYDPVDNKPFRIGRVKVLNHRWIIAEYSNGKIWGEVFVKYFINDNEPTKFETIETVIYQNTF